MDTDSLEGMLDNGAGRLEAATGEVLDDPALKVKGEVRQFRGQIEETAGAAKERLAAAAERARDIIAKAADQAGDAYGSARERAQSTADATDAFVKARPYVALGLGVLAGFIIGGLFLSRGPKVIYIRPAHS
jgi:ElaB/YqjD/DUF883 family membrane-anchored ribosome-binding protein